MRIDAHTHLEPLESSNDISSLLSMLDKHSIDTAVVFLNVDDIGSSPGRLTRANDALANAVSSAGGRLVGFGSVNPAHGSHCLRELESFRQRDLSGIKLHPPVQGIVATDRGLMRDTCQMAAEHKLPIAIYAGLQLPGIPYVFMSLHELATLVGEHPATTFILCHSAFGSRDVLGIGELAGHTNVWFETSGVCAPSLISELARQTGGKRVMYGSAFPYLAPEVELLKVDLAELSAGGREAVLGTNAAALLAGK